MMPDSAPPQGNCQTALQQFSEDPEGLSPQHKEGVTMHNNTTQGNKKLLALSLRIETELRNLSCELLLLKREGCKKISRELHDAVAGAVTGISVHLGVLRKSTSASSKQLHRKIADTLLLVHQVVDVVHRLNCELRPSALEDLGFIPAIRSHIHALRDRSKLRIFLRVTPAIELYAMTEKIAIFRVVQESLCNVVQHAKATKVSISLTRNRNGLRLCIRDDGTGFSIPDPLCIVGSSQHGLLGMRERMEMIGGSLHIVSGMGKSTVIRALLPSLEQFTNKCIP